MIAFLRRWGWLLLFAAGAIIIYLVSAGKVRLNVQGEVAAAKADAKATKLVAEVGHTEALKQIEEHFDKVLTDLDTEQRTQAVVLRSDPAALSRFLARAASGKRKA